MFFFNDKTGILFIGQLFYNYKGEKYTNINSFDGSWLFPVNLADFYTQIAEIYANRREKFTKFTNKKSAGIRTVDPLF